MLTATSLMLFVSSAAQSCSYVCLDIVSKETVRTYFLFSLIGIYPYYIG